MLALMTDEHVSEQLISREDLERASFQLGSMCSSSENYVIEKLDQNCISLLTREVKYQRLVFESIDANSRVELKMSESNDFPVIGFELWKNGCKSLPGGTLSLVTNDNVLRNLIVNAVLDQSNI